MNVFNIQYRKVFTAGIVSVVFLSAAVSCKPKFYEEPTPGAPGAGNADFTTYVAVGSNITAGWMDGVYYTEGQNNAYPNLIAAKIKVANSNALFNQPDINSADGWAGTGKGRLYFPTPACTSVNFSPTNVTPGQGSLLPFTGDITKVTNLAVPFQTVTELNTSTVTSGTAYNNSQPYFYRLFGSASTTLGTSSEVKERNPTFFTAWYGYQDALKYATSGGTSTLVADAVFQQNIEQLLDSLLVNPNAKGVIALIPYVDLFPVITNNNRRLTSSSDPARLPIRLTATQAATYNAALGVTFFSGATGNKNYLAITTGTGAIIQMNTSKDFITRGNILDSTGIGQRDPNAVRTCTPNTQNREERGLLTAIPNNSVLDRDEITYLRSRIDGYNNIIRNAVAARNLSGTRIGIVDLNTFYTTLTDPLYGIKYNSPTGFLVIRANHPSLGPDYGGFYSLDRTYPNPRGQAALANEFIKTINATFGSTLSLYDPAAFRVNVLP